MHETLSGRKKDEQKEQTKAIIPNNQLIIHAVGYSKCTVHTYIMKQKGTRKEFSNRVFISQSQQSVINITSVIHLS